jgi:hypothetical protein
MAQMNKRSDEQAARKANLEKLIQIAIEAANLIEGKAVRY